MDPTETYTHTIQFKIGKLTGNIIKNFIILAFLFKLFKLAVL